MRICLEHTHNSEALKSSAVDGDNKHTIAANECLFGGSTRRREYVNFCTLDTIYLFINKQMLVMHIQLLNNCNKSLKREEILWPKVFSFICFCLYVCEIY